MFAGVRGDGERRRGLGHMDARRETGEGGRWKGGLRTGPRGAVRVQQQRDSDVTVEACRKRPEAELEDRRLARGLEYEYESSCVEHRHKQ